jgi:hypothetical protein
MQTTRCLVLSFSGPRFVSNPQFIVTPLGFAAQHCYHLKSICYIAIDLCLALALSLVVSHPRAERMNNTTNDDIEETVSRVLRDRPGGTGESTRCRQEDQACGRS